MKPLKFHRVLFGAVTRTVLVFAAAAPAFGDSLHRLYTFEEGSPGATAAEVIDSLGDPPHLLPAFGDAYLAFDSHIAGSNDSVPIGQPVQTWINANVDPTPSMTAPFAGTEPTFVDVSDGSALDSPSLGSSVALDFSGAQALQGPGFKDSYVELEAYNNNDPAATNTNVLTTYFTFSQAWVYPDSAGQGTAQVVWAIGRENGGARITSDGFWTLTSLGSATGAEADIPVVFDEWTHVAVARGGGSATLYVNGAVASTANGFFGAFGDEVTLGTESTFFEIFDGKVDSFGVGGNHDGSFVPFDDIDYFEDLGILPPTGVAGDVDQDGDADQDDYLIWSANVGFSNNFGFGDVTTLLKGDLDDNGRVDAFDFFEIASAVEAAGGSLTLVAAAPEPSSLALTAAAALALVRRRRKR